MEAACIPDNIASVRLLEKTGFQREGFAADICASTGSGRTTCCTHGSRTIHRRATDAEDAAWPPVIRPPSAVVRGSALGSPWFGCYNAGDEGAPVGKVEQFQWVGGRIGEGPGSAARRRWSLRFAGGGLFVDLRGDDSPTFTGKISSYFSSSSAPRDGLTRTATGEPAAPEIECPGVDVRQGAGTLHRHQEQPGDAGRPALPVSFAQAARECLVQPGILTMKVGVEGRVILGPAGGPGQVEDSAALRGRARGARPKTIVTRSQAGAGNGWTDRRQSAVHGHRRRVELPDAVVFGSRGLCRLCRLRRVRRKARKSRRPRARRSDAEAERLPA